MWLPCNVNFKHIRLANTVATLFRPAWTLVQRRLPTRHCRLAAGVRAPHRVSVEHEPLAVIFIFRVNSCRRDNSCDLLAARKLPEKPESETNDCPCAEGRPREVQLRIIVEKRQIGCDREPSKCKGFSTEMCFRKSLKSFTNSF